MFDFSTEFYQTEFYHNEHDANFEAELCKILGNDLSL